MATATPSPPGDPATRPYRTLPISHRQARNHQPEGPDHRRDRNREDCADATVRDGHSTHRPDVEAESPVHPCQLSRVPRQPLHDPQTGTAEVHPAVSPARILQRRTLAYTAGPAGRSEEHTSELQSHHDLVCRLLLENKKTSQ